MTDAGASSGRSAPLGVTANDLAVRVEVPARAAYLRYVRLAAAAMGNDVGYSVGTIDALRTAVDELCALALGGAMANATLEVTMAMDARTVGLTGSCGPIESPPEPDPVAHRIVDELALDHLLWHEGSECRFWMRFVA